MKITILVAGLFLSVIYNTYGQSFSVLPKNMLSNSSSSQLGNFSRSNSCDGTDPRFLKVIIKPSCYGANLRGGGSALDPKGKPIEMNVTLSNSGSVFSSNITFPVKTVWPENYGETCTWNNLSGSHSVICTTNGVKVDYGCSLKKADIFLDDTLECTRYGDPLNHQKLNEKLSCLFFYSWKGTGYGYEDSYSRKEGYANCGLREKDEEYGSQMVVTTTKTVGSTIKFAKRGEISVVLRNADIKKVGVTQDLTSGEYKTSGSRSNVSVEFKQDGKRLSYKVEKGLDDFEQCLTIKPSFLGQNQFCGSYYSPLMLFFSEERPLFVGKSSFPLRKGQAVTNWVEKNAPGYFLAIDKNGDGMINSSKELFGDNREHANGFENLKSYDDNLDYKIDSKDKVFSKLLVWKDKNGDGISQSNEIKKISEMSVVSLSTYYKKGNKSYGSRAEAREKGWFTFKENSKEVKGEVLDIWFSPVE